MKLFVILAAVAWCNAAKLDNTYLPPSRSLTSGGSPFLQTPLGPAQNGRGFDRSGQNVLGHDNGYGQNGNGFNQNGDPINEYTNFGSLENSERPRAAFDRNAAILRQDSQNDGEAYSYAYETENGIYAEESGVATNGVEAQGGYSYTGDDGQVYSVRYTADQNGFVPQGDHLPTPPPVPEEILRALEQNARDEAAGIYDDGSYSEGKYSDDEQQYNYNSGNGNAFNHNDYEDDDSVVTTNALFRQTANFNRASSQTYLPPGRGNRGGSSGNSNSQRYNGNQRSQYLPPFAGQISNNGNSASPGPRQAYLPPFAGQRGSGNYRNGNNQGGSEASKTYLPPQRSNGFGSRPAFSARNGYRY